MKTSLEVKALEWALLAALFSLGGAWLATIPIKMMTGSSAVPTATSSAAAAAGIVATPELVAQGHQFYDMSCSHCHGDDATGDEGPDLHNLTISNARIAATIKKGVKGEMPTFAKKYDDKQISALVSYLRSLR
jgi:mono/diheme cytochrome c family protein